MDVGAGIDVDVVDVGVIDVVGVGVDVSAGVAVCANIS